MQNVDRGCAPSAPDCVHAAAFCSHQGPNLTGLLASKRPAPMVSSWILSSTVSPDDKLKAREAALAFLRRRPEADLIRILRINSPRSAIGLHDLLALLELGGWPDAVIIPKCESADEIRVVADILSASQSPIGIIPMVELARAGLRC